MTVTTTLISMGTIPLWLFIYERAETRNENFPIPFDRIGKILCLFFNKNLFDNIQVTDVLNIYNLL